MKVFVCFSLVLLFAGLINAQPKNIWVNWKCNMEFEILSGRFDPATDTASVRGFFNNWVRFDLYADPLDPNIYVTPYPILFWQLNVGDTVDFYKFWYTLNFWEVGDNRFYILTQDDYNNGAATISRTFNDATLNTVTHQETTIQFTADCNGAVYCLNGPPFPVLNTCHIAGSTFPLQWPFGWQNNAIGMMFPMYDDGIHGNDPIAGDKVFNASVVFPIYTPFPIWYLYNINYGDSLNNGGGNYNECSGHNIELSQYMVSATVENVFGTGGYHNLINVIFVPVELTSFTASVTENNVKLNWSTKTELNNQSFEIERKNESSTYEKIGYVPGSGTTTEPRSYSLTDNDLQPGKYTYRLKQIDFNGSYEYSLEVEVEVATSLAFALEQNYPNPFNPTTVMKYSIPEASKVMLKLFNILGEEVATMVNEEKVAGYYTVEFNASSLSSGIYFYQLQSGSFIETKKMLLLK